MQKMLYAFFASLWIALPNALAGEAAQSTMSEGFYIALSGLLSVFVGLTILMLAIWITGKVVQKAVAKRAAETQKSAEQKT